MSRPSLLESPTGAGMSERQHPERGGKERLQPLLFAASLVVLAGVVLLGRLPGLDPPSLWLDDEWVAVLVRAIGIGEFLDLKPTTPLSFVLVLKLFARLSADPEWPLQLFPMLCSVAQVPLMALLVLRTTGRRSLALLGAALLAVDPIQVEYAVRVKQFPCDTLATLVLLLVGLPLLLRWTSRRSVGLALLALLLLTLSFPSILVGFALLHLGWLGVVLPRGGERRGWRGATLVVAGFDLAVALLWFTLLRSQGSDVTRGFWEGFYLPPEPLAALRFLADRGFDALRLAFPPSLAPILLFAPLGLFALLRDPARRRIGILGLCCWAGLAAASALRLYPLGGGRTDAFVHPVTILFVLSAALLLPAAWQQTRLFAGALLSATILLLALFLVPSSYRPCGDALAVRKTVEVARGGDALVLYPHAAIAAGVYGPWPFEVVPWPEYAHRFHLRVARPATLTLSPFESYWENPAPLDSELLPFLEVPRRRILYLAAGDIQPRPHAWIVDRIVERGYRPTGAFRFDRAGLFVFEPAPRNGAGPAAE